MDKLKALVHSRAGKAILGFLGVLLFALLLIRLMGHNNIQQAATAMQAQHETLMGRDVHYTTQETLNTLIGESENVKKSIELLTDDIATLKKTIKNNDAKITLVENDTKKLKNKVVNEKHQAQEEQYHIEKQASNWIWVQDSVVVNAPIVQSFSPANTQGEKKDTIKPTFTIPQNTWLTGVIPEQPLIGIVPVNGQVMNPQSVSFVVGADNLAANRWQLPNELQGIQGDAVCEGFFAIKRPAVTCKVTSLTFIFDDGTIHSVNAKEDKSLGVVTDEYGNPQIAGALHSNLGYFLAGSALFSGVQGYGNALSAAQMQTTTGTAVPGVSTIIGNANTYAQGQGLSQASREANQWWVQRMKSTFDYVEVQNWDENTHQLLQLNVKITQSINIDYDDAGRKVDYANTSMSPTNHRLD